jgi:hypothetical protein
MKKVLVVALLCAVSSFAAWDNFPVIGDGKGEAKIAFYQGRQKDDPNGWGPDHEFKIRYSPMANLELMSKTGYILDAHHYVLGARFQVLPILSAGVDVGFPIPNSALLFTPNAQFSMPLTSALEFGSNFELTIPTEDEGKYTDVMYFKAGAELDLTIGQSIVWVGFDIGTGIGEDSNKAKASESGKGLKLSPAIGYVALVGNMSLGTLVGMDFGEKSDNDPYNTTIGIDASWKF